MGSQVYSPGANSAIANVVPLLSVAEILGKVDPSEWKKTVVMSAFQGEKFGFVGSRRFLNDVNQAEKDPQGWCRQRAQGASTPLGTSFCTDPMMTSDKFQYISILNRAEY